MNEEVTRVEGEGFSTKTMRDGEDVEMGPLLLAMRPYELSYKLRPEEITSRKVLVDPRLLKEGEVISSRLLKGMVERTMAAVPWLQHPFCVPIIKYIFSILIYYREGSACGRAKGADLWTHDYSFYWSIPLINHKQIQPDGNASQQAGPLYNFIEWTFRCVAYYRWRKSYF